MREPRRLAADLEDLAEFIEENAADLRIVAWVYEGSRQRRRACHLCPHGERRVRDLIEVLREAAMLARQSKLNCVGAAL
ncbi:MAG TPA: hypothetical protein VG826_29110 [Pirellulales bacterium]|nr:hypothetical protein [Pirellulales bacterium]